MTSLKIPRGFPPEPGDYPEVQSRALLESLRWPNGATCPHCANESGQARVYTITAKPSSLHPARPGLYKCADCRKQFTVTSGTIFHDTHLPARKLVRAIFLLQNGLNISQLHRRLDITYKSAWNLAKRIRSCAINW